MASKQMGADTTLKFLYSVLKQLEVKNVRHLFCHTPNNSRARFTDIIVQVDWNAVAKDLDISNGAAARMRWFRFKQQMDGVPRNKPSPDARVTKPRPKAKGKANPKGKKGLKAGTDEEMKD